MKNNISLSAKDICSIVKACASGGVSEITIGDLYINFGDKQPLLTDSDVPTFIHYESQDLPGSKDDSTQDSKLKSPLEKESAPIPDDLYITDPLAWEELNTRG